MATIPGPHAIVIIDQHEPEHEVASRLLELAEEKGHDVRAVEAQRGEHDAPLSFRVPKDVAEEFDKDRAKRWTDKIENDKELADGQDSAAVDEDAVAAENIRRTRAVREANTTEKTSADRKSGKPRE